MSSELKLIWRIAEVTPEVSRKATHLQKAIREACEIEPEDINSLINYSYYLAATGEMKSPPNARASVRNLAAFIEKWEGLPPVEVWNFHQTQLPHKLRQVWDEAFDDAQNLFETDSAELPESGLTPVQREEAAKSGSPLP